MCACKDLSFLPQAFICMWYTVRIFWFVCFGSCLAMGLAAQSDYAVLDVMTYNIKYDNPADGPNNWDNRQAPLTALVAHYQPDIIGTQEGLKHQLDHIAKTVAQYRYIGGGRDDGRDKGEYTAIFYNKARLRLLQDSTFWLSRTPDRPGKDWDAAIQRICTFALFEDLLTQKRYWVFNTHFDHIGEEARRQSAKLILQVIREQTATAPHPVILLGDFNAEPEQAPIKVITEDMIDARAVSSQPPYGPTGTFNAFAFDKPIERRIDYVFIGGPLRVQTYTSIDDHYDLRYPSDHLPVLVRLSL